jgi:hypothetical protein
MIVLLAGLTPTAYDLRQDRQVCDVSEVVGHTVWGSPRAAKSRPHQRCRLIIGITSVTRSANSVGNPLDRGEKRLVVNRLGEIGGGPG